MIFEEAQSRSGVVGFRDGRLTERVSGSEIPNVIVAREAVNTTVEVLIKLGDEAEVAVAAELASDDDMYHAM